MNKARKMVKLCCMADWLFETMRYQVGVASLWPLATVAGAESLYICMKKTSYEYEVGWCSQSYVAVDPHGKTKRISYECWFYLFHEQISGWGCILMTTRHSSRCWKSLYMYEKVLPWVWSGLVFSIICNSRTPWQNQENLLPVLVLPPPLADSRLRLHPYDHSPQ